MTKTYTVGKSTSLEYTHSVSTIYETITAASIPTAVPAHGPSVPHNSVVLSTSSIIEVGVNVKTSAVPHVPAGSSGYVKSSAVPHVPASSPGYIKSSAAPHVPAGSPGYIKSSAVPHVPAGSSGPSVPGAPGSPNTYSILTKTIVPVPSAPLANIKVSSSIIPGAPGYAHPSATEAASSIPFPVGNGHGKGNGTIGGPTGTSASNVPVPTYSEFKGAASKMGAGMMTVVVAAVAMMVLL